MPAPPLLGDRLGREEIGHAAEGSLLGPEVELEARGHDPDHRVVGAVDGQDPTERVRAAPEALHVKPVAQDHRPATAVAPLLLGHESAAERRCDPQDLEETLGHEPGRRTQRCLVGAGQIDTERDERGERLEGLAPLAPIDEVGGRDDVGGPVAHQVVLPDHHQAIGIGEGERAQEHRVGDGEDREAGCQGETQQCRQAGVKARPRLHRPQCLPEVL